MYSVYNVYVCAALLMYTEQYNVQHSTLYTVKPITTHAPFSTIIITAHQIKIIQKKFKSLVGTYHRYKIIKSFIISMVHTHKHTHTCTSALNTILNITRMCARFNN